MTSSIGSKRTQALRFIACKRAGNGSEESDPSSRPRTSYTLRGLRASFATESIRPDGFSRRNGCCIGVSVSLLPRVTTRPLSRKPTLFFRRQMGVTCDFLRTDGYEEARNANADFVFLDPPFSSESRQDWCDMAHACTRLGPKKIPFVVWYPCSGSSKPQELVDGTGCAALEVWWDEYAAPQSQSMKGCGMLVSPDLMPIMETAAGELGLLAGALRAQR